MKVESLFDGIGGFPLAFQRAGAEVLVGVEIDPRPVKIVKRRQADGLLGTYPVWRDVRDFRSAGADILTAGWPCQGNSTAGKRNGLRDDRSSLWWEVVRVLRDGKHQWFLGENVPGLFTVNDGLDFLEVLRSLDALGYGVAWRVLDSQYFGVPQRRERIFVVGHLGGPCPPEVLFEPESSEWHFAESFETRQDASASNKSSSRGAGGAGYEDLPDMAGPLGGGAYGAGRMSEDLPNIAYCLKAEGDRIHADGSDNLVIAAPLSAGSNPNSSAAGRRREDDVNLVIISQQNGSASLEDQVGTIQTNGDNRGWALMSGKMLRRLSPLECERVQGYPDAWTCLCGKGLGRALYGCKCPDSPRYHALGNSISIPPVEWIASRIVKHGSGDRKEMV